MTKPECPLVIIHWLDSRQPAPSWKRLADIEEPDPVRCVSVGWLLYDEDDSKMLCPNMGDIGDDAMQGSGMIEIPAACITRIDPLIETDKFSKYFTGKVGGGLGESKGSKGINPSFLHPRKRLLGYWFGVKFNWIAVLIYPI